MSVNTVSIVIPVLHAMASSPLSVSTTAFEIVGPSFSLRGQ